jgi:hypothetical protein
MAWYWVDCLWSNCNRTTIKVSEEKKVLLEWLAAAAVMVRPARGKY